jgi:hypothetical protein
MDEIRGLRADVSEIKQELAERRGVERVLRWAAGSGGLVGLVGGFVAFFSAWTHRPGAP